MNYCKYTYGPGPACIARRSFILFLPGGKLIAHHYGRPYPGPSLVYLVNLVNTWTEHLETITKTQTQ